MSNNFRRVNTALPLAVTLTAEEEEVKECLHEGQVLSLECSHIERVTSVLDLLSLAIEDFGNSDTSGISGQLIDYTGNELLNGPALEASDADNEAGFIKRSLITIVNFFKRITAWVKGKLQSVVKFIRVKFSKRRRVIKDILKKFESGEITSTWVKLTNDPVKQLQTLKTIRESFDVAVNAPDGTDDDDLDAWKMDNESQRIAIDQVLKNYGDGDAIVGERNEVSSDEGEVLIDVNYMLDLDVYYTVLDELIVSATATLSRITKSHSKLVNSNGDHSTLAYAQEMMKSAKLAIDVINKLTKSANTETETIVKLLTKPAK